MSSRFDALAIEIASKFAVNLPSIHSGLGKTLLRLGTSSHNELFFNQVVSKILPDLIRPDGELAGVYLRGVLCFQGYTSGLDFFNRCSSEDSHYRIILPDFLFGLYENQFYVECIDYYNTLCERLHWRHVHSIYPGTETAYYHRQKGIKVLQHSRVYSAVIGSALALDDVELADQLLAEMRFWDIQPLRETYYDYLNVSENE